jgi:uncharacterized membrane protein (UPF0136 family)
MDTLKVCGEALLAYYGTISIVCRLVAFFAGLVFNRSADTHERVTKAGAAITVPFGLVLIYAALDPTALARMSEVPRSPLALGGIAILCIYFQAATKRAK